MNALAPQLQQMQVANAATNQATDAQATGSGAYGDARTGIQQANNSFNQNVAQEGLIGNAYNSAFNTAIGAGAQDSANQLSAANSNAGYNETALNRALGGATALEGLQTQQQGVQTTANTAAQQDTAEQQAQLTAQYNQWLMAQQYPFQTSGLADSAISAANPANPTTTTSTQPDNSGYAILGAALGTAGGAYLKSDRRLKQDIDEVGMLKDGTPVYSFSYKADPKHIKMIGLMAQDVKKRRPDAVITLDDEDGMMAVDYSLATENSRLMSIAI
jgi:Chaperone of endosialidase